MQKLIFRNSLNEEIDLTSGYFGITNWKGFDNVGKTLQTQTVPFTDGSVYIDSLLNNRELSVTLAMADGNNLDLRYELRRKLIEILNPKLGEGYLIYKNNYLERQIKVTPNLPLFANKNSNDKGTYKASLVWTACNPYWEDLDEKTFIVKAQEPLIIKNEGDYKVEPVVNFIGQGTSVNLRNNDNGSKIEVENIIGNISVDLSFGKKNANKLNSFLSIVGGSNSVETKYAQYFLYRNCVLKTKDFENFEVIKVFNASISSITADDENVYVGSSNTSGLGFVGRFDKDDNYTQLDNAGSISIIYHSKLDNKLYMQSSNSLFSIDDWNSPAPVLVESNMMAINEFAIIGNKLYCCTNWDSTNNSALYNVTNKEFISLPNIDNKDIECITAYSEKDYDFAIGIMNYVYAYDIGLTKTETLFELYNSELEVPDIKALSLYFNKYNKDIIVGGNQGTLKILKVNGALIDLSQTQYITTAFNEIFYSELFGNIQTLNGDIGIIENYEYKKITFNEDVNFLCCKYSDKYKKYFAGALYGKIYTSVDFKKWEKVYDNSSVGNITLVESDEDEILFISENGTLIYSLDGEQFSIKVLKNYFESRGWCYNENSRKYFYNSPAGICSIRNPETDNPEVVCNYVTNSLMIGVSLGNTIVFCGINYSNELTSFAYSLDAGETWTIKNTSSTIIIQSSYLMWDFLRVLDGKIFLGVNTVETQNPCPFYIWNSTTFDFEPVTCYSEDYGNSINNFIFFVNYSGNKRFIAGNEYIKDSGLEFLIVFKMEYKENPSLPGEMALVFTKVFGNSENKGIYSYTEKNNHKYYTKNELTATGTIVKSYCDNDVLTENAIIVIINDYISLMNVETNHVSVLDSNNHVISEFSITGDSIINIIGTNLYWYGALAKVTNDWQYIQIGSSMDASEISDVVNYKNKILIASNDKIYDKSGKTVYSLTHTVKNMYADDENLYATSAFFFAYFNGTEWIQRSDSGMSKGKFIVVNKKYLYFLSAGNHALEKYTIENSQVNTIYHNKNISFNDITYDPILDRIVLCSAGSGFISIIAEKVIDESLFNNAKFNPTAFIKNKSLYFIGIYGFFGYIFEKSDESIIEKVKSMNFYLDVGDNKIILNYEGDFYKAEIKFRQKYVGV